MPNLLNIMNHLKSLFYSSSKQTYVPRVYGFRISSTSPYYEKHDVSKNLPREATEIKSDEKKALR